MSTIKLAKEEVAFIKKMSALINDGENNWYYLPYWFKQVGDDTFELTQFEKLPESVTDIIKAIRGDD